MIKVGDIVRSYDFPLDDKNYIEGYVRAIAPWEHCEFNCGLDHLHIEVIIDTCIPTNDPDCEARDWVYPVHPDSGALGFMRGGRAARIEVVG